MASNEAEGEGSMAIEMENLNNPLVASLRQMLDVLPPISHDHCIYRVPQSVHQSNEKFYTPQKVSIGPLHHGKQNLLPMEEQKLRYFSTFLDRAKLSLEVCTRFIRGIEQRVRNCYVESINLSSDEFVKMILVDSSYIIEVIQRACDSMPIDEMDYLSNPFSLFGVIRRDMTLLENQIPLFAIAGLFAVAFPNSPETEPSFAKLSVLYFADVSPLLIIDDFTQEKYSRLEEAKHFVDLMRLCHLPSVRRSHLPNNPEYMTIPTARELKEVGMTITKGPSKELVDIKYANGVLRIPQFQISDDSEILVRNIIAYEMYKCIGDSYIIDYAVFMDNLIDTADDVDILVQNGVLTNVLDRAAAAILFNSLTADIVGWVGAQGYYNDLIREVNDYCKVPWHRWRAIMKHDYFSTPWRIFSILAAVILLVLTLIQTVCAIIQTWK